MIAKGEFGWDKSERVSNRYGAVMVTDHNETSKIINKDKIEDNIGNKGKLKATVIKGKKSGHIGDIVCGLYQNTIPEEGETYDLGSGELFIEENCSTAEESQYMDPIGIKPEDYQNKNHWLDSEVLYDINDCIVKLEFIPEEESDT